MNYARLDKSERLQRVLSLLKNGGEYSTMDIITKASVCAVNSIIAEIRANGYAVECHRRGYVWYYKLHE